MPARRTRDRRSRATSRRTIPSFVSNANAGTRESNSANVARTTGAIASADAGPRTACFYLLPWSGQWKQVWVTGTATRTEGVKEKELISVGEDGSVQFQGRIPDAAGDLWYDRTTLTPLDGGGVRQVIEISRNGADWQVTFDAVYRRRSGAG